MGFPPIENIDIQTMATAEYFREGLKKLSFPLKGWPLTIDHWLLTTSHKLFRTFVEEVEKVRMEIGFQNEKFKWFSIKYS